MSEGTHGPSPSPALRPARILGPIFAAALGAAPLGDAVAREPREGTVRILSPLPAGSTSDIVARLVADCLQRRGNASVIVEDRPGATGRIAIQALKQGRPDGSALLLAPIALPVIVPLTLRDPGYDPVRDLLPVGQVSRYEFALAVAADHPAQTLQEFIDWARAHPRQATYGTAGEGSLPHFLGVALRQAAGIELEHVAYNGAGGVVTDLIGGRIAGGVSALSDFLLLHRGGRLRILATSGAVRSGQLPEVATFGQQGYPRVTATGWHGLFAPAGTPSQLRQTLSASLVECLRLPEVTERLRALGLEPTGTTPEELATIVASDSAYWSAVLKAAGFVAQ